MITKLQLDVLKALSHSLSGGGDGSTSGAAQLAKVPTNRARGRLHRLLENGYVDSTIVEAGESLWTITRKGRATLKASRRSRKVA